MTTVKVVPVTMMGRFYSDSPTTPPDAVAATCQLMEVPSDMSSAPRTTVSLTMTRAQADAMRYDRIYQVTFVELEPVDPPEEPPVETPVETPIETPIETPTGAPEETPIETPIETPTTNPEQSEG